MLRTDKKRAATITLIGDIFKGYASVVLARSFMAHPVAQSFAGVAAVWGHCFPLYHHFKGGKGVAATLGSCFALTPIPTIAIIGIWLIIAVPFKMSSLASIVCVVLLPLFASFWESPTFAAPLWLITALVVWRHKENIKRLARGEENSW